MVDIGILALNNGLAAIASSLALTQTLGGGFSGSGSSLLSSESASTISQMSPDSSAQNTTNNANADGIDTLGRVGGGDINCDITVTRPSSDICGRILTEQLQQQQQQIDGAVEIKKNFEIDPQAIPLISKLDMVVNTAHDKLRINNSNGDSAGGMELAKMRRKKRRAIISFIRRANNTDFQSSASIKSNFPKRKGQGGAIVPPKPMFNLIDDPVLNATALMRYWYTLTKKEQIIVRDQLKELWKYDEKVAKDAARAAKKKEKSKVSAVNKTARNKNRKRKSSAVEPPLVCNVCT